MGKKSTVRYVNHCLNLISDRRMKIEMKNNEKEKNKNVWNYILIVVVILGIIVGYLSYLQDKKMDKMEEELDSKETLLLKEQK